MIWKWGVGFWSFFVFLFFQAQGIAGGDSGDLVSAACTFGVPHPPGYPLYTLLGFLLCKIPIFTPSWRVAVASSLPHAIVISLVFYLIYSITKKTYSALFGSLILLGNYVYFLYSVTPEVFALFDLFVVIVISLMFLFTRSKDVRYWYLTVFVFGLSLTHHHVILFLTPALGYWLYVHKHILRKIYSRTMLLRTLCLFALGLLPYLYVVLSGFGTSIIVWDNPTTVSNFIRLVTRSDYGTFVSNAAYGELFIQRFLSVRLYLDFIGMDFQLIGIIAIVAGFYALWRKQRKLFWFFSIAICSIGPFFFFYASFPLTNRFTLGTYERFLLPSYLLLSILCSVGVSHIYDVCVLSMAKKKLLRFANLFGALYVGSLFVLVIFNAYGTQFRFWGLPRDRTVDAYARDILASAPPKSIVFLSGDMPLFSVQYARYVLGVRPDVVVIHNGRLDTPEYTAQIRKYFPEIVIPDTKDIPIRLRIVQSNYPQYHILTNRTETVPLQPDFVWVPRGLLFELYPQANAPVYSVMKAQNDVLWNQFNNPIQGILERYNHMMISNVRDMYAYSRIEYGKVLLKAKDYTSATHQFTSAISYGGDMYNAEAYMNLGIAQTMNTNCTDAVVSFQQSRKTDQVKKYEYTKGYEANVYEKCLNNTKKATQLRGEYDASEKSKEIPLE